MIVIENKTDDSGKDVTWQALKYASYCASLTTPQITRLYQAYLDKYSSEEKAETNLLNFFADDSYEGRLNQGNGIRILLVAANFRKEVTSTVLWLLNYNVRLQCHQVKLYKIGEEILLQIEQIIPLRQTQEYTIQMALKQQEEAQTLVENTQKGQIIRRFWQKLLPIIRDKTSLFNSINPVTSQYLSAGSGISLVVYSFTINRNSATVLLNFTRQSVIQNDFLYNELHKQKDKIESNFGGQLTWENKQGNSSCKIICPALNLGGYMNEDKWDELVKQLSETMDALEKATKDPLSAAGQAMPISAMPSEMLVGETNDDLPAV